MTIEAIDSTELEARRAELQALLQSTHFTRAPKLASLLSYLCEKVFADEANQIKEYSIGLEVFHRGASFDQDSDSIVRVEANRLRRRLAEYYAGEGSSHPLRITIPLGQYVPRFEPRAEQSAGKKPISAGSDPSPSQIAPIFRSMWWLIATLALLVVALSGIWIHFRPLGHPTGLVRENEPALMPAESQFGPPVGQEIRILAGAQRSFVDHAGKLWNADSGYSGGTAVKSNVQNIWRTQDPWFYRTSRQGQFRYDIPLNKGIYELRLHFAEMTFGPESTGAGGEGSRIMTVRANGTTLLANFDVVADAGASRTADVKVFPDLAPAADGMLHLEFSGDDGKQATLSAIEILPGARHHMRPVRILTRQSPYYSNESQWWSPDNYFQGGQLATYAPPVGGTDDPELYETERWGNFSYAIPVSPGKYSVTLRFAARHGDWDRPSSGGHEENVVAHTFNVFCNGKVLLQNFNLVKEARQSDVVTRKFIGLEPNAQGKLLLEFVPVDGYATVTGIEVVSL
ncbi:MAG: malectin domain-containing carbohydrate-binding protein [Terracidiphilus sp.]